MTGTLQSQKRVTDRFWCCQWCFHFLEVTLLTIVFFYVTERPLHPDTMVWPLLYEWQNWSSEYRAAACLCLKSSDLREKLEQAVSVSKQRSVKYLMHCFIFLCSSNRSEFFQFVHINMLRSFKYCKVKMVRIA